MFSKARGGVVSDLITPHKSISAYIFPDRMTCSLFSCAGCRVALDSAAILATTQQAIAFIGFTGLETATGLTGDECYRCRNPIITFRRH